MVDLSGLVDADRGVVDRRVFYDAEIYDLELKRIFARCWLFVAHESQIPRAGDFFSTYMGEDPVLVVRQRDASVKVLLNSCRHRGMKVCRADAGNSKAFTCTYHGWTYDPAGTLVSVPNLEDGYRNELDLSEWGLLEAPMVASYRGFVFASWDRSVPLLEDYLGDMRWYFDAFVDRTPEGLEFLPGVHKWVIKGNWKLAAEQFAADMYHLGSSHTSALMALVQQHSDGGAPPPGGRGWKEGYQFGSDLGHGTGFFVTKEEGPSIYPKEIMDYNRGKQFTERLGEARHAGPAGGHANIFPNFSYLSGQNTARVWHPRGPDEIEVWAFTAVDREAPPEIKDAQRKMTMRTFSASGVFEQDDGENWGEVQATNRGVIARRMKLNYSMGLGAYGSNDEFPGPIANVMSEHGARSFYRRWHQLMTEPDQFPHLPPTRVEVSRRTSEGAVSGD